MKKLLNLLTVAIVLSVIFVACDKENGGKNDNGNATTINATNVVGATSNIATVKAFVGGFEVASSKYQNNGFTLKLKKTVPNESLGYVTTIDWKNICSWLWWKGIPYRLISDQSSFCGILEIYAYDNSDRIIGNISLGERRDGSSDYGDYIQVCYVYADKDFSINGVNENCQFNCSFKKGWNIVYLCEYPTPGGDYQYDWVMTSTKPSNANLKWYYNSNN